MQFAETFATRTPRSAELLRSAMRSAPGGSHSTARTVGAGWRPHPPFAAGGEGAHLVDADGRRYIDYLLGLGPLILGHRPAAVLARVVEEVTRLGPLTGLPVELEQVAARQLLAAVPAADAVRFASSGSEAVGTAVRLARAVTGRARILRFEGHYHGWHDSVYWSNKPDPALAGPEAAPVPVPAGPGVPRALEATLVVCPWNDEECVERAFRAAGDDIAAVLTEPVMCNAGCIPPKPGYLQFLRRVTRRHGALLIFDEVITGFRLAFGGAQELYGVQPDISTFAKALGGGFPVAAIAGTWPVMRWIAEGRYSHSGTYNANVVAMAAAGTTLEELRRPGTYETLHELGGRLMEGLRSRFLTAGIPVTVQGVGPVLQVWFASGPIDSWRDARACAHADMFRAFWEEMMLRGVLFHPSQFEKLFLSTAHRHEHVVATLDALDDAMPALRARAAELGIAP